MVTALLHADLLVRDLERSLQFYVGLLGCTVVDQAELEGAVPAFYSHGAARRMRLVMLQVSSGPWGAMLELMQLESPGAPAAGGAHVTFLVADLDAACVRLAEGGVLLAGPVERVDLPRLGSSRIAFVHDPDGHVVELIESLPI
jgi:catechol 2,3-dioxygenase-like lactoylglutathione lyase family enzyme